MQQYRYHCEAMIELLPGGDQRAIGGAVTVALCGHWVHEGPCLWRHVTEVRARADGTLVAKVRFDCNPADEPDVRQRIRAAIAQGSLIGPDGRKTAWRVLGS